MLSRASEKALHLPHEGFIHLVFSLHCGLRHHTHVGGVDQAHVSGRCLLFLPVSPSHAFVSSPSTPCSLQRANSCPVHWSALVPAHSQCRGHEAGDLRLWIDDLRFCRDGGSTGTSTCCQTASGRCDGGDTGPLLDGGCVVVASRVAARSGGGCPRWRRHLHDSWSHWHGRGWHNALRTIRDGY